MRKNSTLVLALFTVVALFTPLLSLVGCTSSQSSLQRIADIEGLNNFKTDGYGFFACSKDDSFSTKFTAVKNGKPVAGVICSGWFKGSTVRYF